MQLIANKKKLFICLLLCTLFLSAFTGIFGPYGVFFSGGNGAGSAGINGNQTPFAMAGGIHSGSGGYLAVVSSGEYSSIPQKDARQIGAKTNFQPFHAVFPVPAACAILIARLSERQTIQQFSSTMTIFLHDQDGMK